MNVSDPFSKKRKTMVEDQLLARGIKDRVVLDAMSRIPRHLFVPKENIPFAYHDGALSISDGQTISQPYIVALMSSLLELNGSEKVLEIGTGSGYQTAVLSALAAEVHTVEIITSLSNQAQKILASLDCQNIHYYQADGSLGWPQAAPYNGIIVTAGAPSVPGPLLQQLSLDGRLVIPVGPRSRQQLQVWYREKDGWAQDESIPVVFVPLIGQYGWPTTHLRKSQNE
ncbi:MAG: protein-L-isoaspartate(D-aspartate) O-methyltransferase [Anaerolineales bacterium]|nr:protein-L-isoaspartate(D-aspartate) O-methyltransferase [Anaerolineales bacterium]